MKKILASALVLSLAVGSAAMAQPSDQGQRDRQGSTGRMDNGYGRDNRGRADQPQAYDNRGGHDRYQRRHRHQVCTIRHHRRVCYWQ